MHREAQVFVLGMECMSKAVNFYDLVKKDQGENIVTTENGAVMHETSRSALLDMNFKVSSYRNLPEEEILRDFMRAYAEDPALALKWVFYVGDVREGLGERRLFRTLIKYVLPRHKGLVNYVGEFNRFDALFELFGTDAEKEMVEFVKAQLNADNEAMAAGKPCSLLAKWMPSVNTSSDTARTLAKKFCAALGYSEKKYRKMLSALRGHLNVLERKLCAGQWGSVDYSAVPSKANLLYVKAFMRHDAERRAEYLQKLANGEEKINSSVAFPHDICHKYYSKAVGGTEVDPALEAMWKALPDVTGGAPMIVVRDGSGSMFCNVGDGSVLATDVATALAIYFSERCSEAYRDKFITFSDKPRLVSLKNHATLRDKMWAAYAENECADTNIEAVFDLLLKVARSHHVRQKDIPSVLVISDMEFNGCIVGDNFSRWDANPKTLFDNIAKRWEDAGYSMPHLIFWNVNSRTHGIPVQENECGVSLVSGFSPNAYQMVVNGRLDPFEAMAEVLNGERYARIV